MCRDSASGWGSKLGTPAARSERALTPDAARDQDIKTYGFLARASPLFFCSCSRAFLVCMCGRARLRERSLAPFLPPPLPPSVFFTSLSRHRACTVFSAEPLSAAVGVFRKASTRSVTTCPQPSSIHRTDDLPSVKEILWHKTAEMCCYAACLLLFADHLLSR